MAITYIEFDTTPATLIADLKTRILTNPAWSDQGVVAVTATSTNATTAAGSTVILNDATGFTVGQWIVANPGGSELYREITAVSGNTITISGTWTVILPIGTTYRTRNTVLRSTSDRGADLIVDLEGGQLTAAAYTFQVYRQYTGTAPAVQTPPRLHSIFWRVSGGTMTQVLHVVLSVSKNHLYFSIEGPRGNEAGTFNTSVGSLRNYFALCDLIPYHAADTVPAAVAIGVTNISSTPSVQSYSSHNVYISRDAANTVTWSPGRIASLDWPTIHTSEVVTMNRTCTIDGNTYMFPYVLFSETEGIRGRLSSFFYCGTSAIPTVTTDIPEPVGSKVTYDGIVYRLLAVNKGDGTNPAWGPFGAVVNQTQVTRSIVVAVPFADA